MTWVQAFQSMLPRPERRSDDEINDDLAAEFAFHLEQSERALVAEGEAPEAAAAIARRRFGNIEDIKRRCRRIAMEERIMLQRFNAVMMVVVTLIVIGLGVQVWMMQRENTMALREMTAQISRMNSSPAAGSTTGGPAGESIVLVEGDVPKPGWFPIALDRNTTCGEILRKAGATDNQWVTYLRGGQRPAYGGEVLRVRDFFHTSAKSVVSRPRDEFAIKNEVNPSQRRGYHLARWSVCYSGAQWTTTDSSDSSKTWTLTIEPNPNEHDMKATLKSSDGSIELPIVFTREGLRFSVVLPPDPRTSGSGRPTAKTRSTWATAAWDVENDRLTLDFRNTTFPKRNDGRTDEPVSRTWPEGVVAFEMDPDKWCGSIEAVVEPVDSNTAIDGAALDNDKKNKVSIEGEVELPGWYPVEWNGQAVLLNDLLRQVRVTDPNATVTVNGRQRYSCRELLENKHKVLTKPGQQIIVYAASDAGGFATVDTSKLSAGMWRQVTASGEPVAEGASIVVTAADDLMNLNGTPIGTLTFTASSGPINLKFNNAQPPDLNLELSRNEPRDRTLSRWSMENDVLSINIAPMIPSTTTPLLFMHEAQAGIRAGATANEHANRPRSGIWAEVDSKGTPLDAGAHLVIMDVDDPRNVNQTVGGVFVIRADAEETGIQFGPQDRQPNMTVMLGTPENSRPCGGHWRLDEQGDLILEIAVAFPDRREPLKLHRTGDAPVTVYAANAGSNGGLIHVNGAVARPGAYNLPGVGQLSLRRLIVSAGGTTGHGPISVRVTMINDRSETTKRYSHENFMVDPNDDVLLKPGDLVEVQQEGGTPAPQQRLEDASRQLSIERERSAAVAAFLQEILAAQNPGGPEISVKEALDNAAKEIETKFADQPEVQAQLRKLIEAKRKELGAGAATAPSIQPAAQP